MDFPFPVLLLPDSHESVARDLLPLRVVDSCPADLQCCVPTGDDFVSPDGVVTDAEVEGVLEVLLELLAAVDGGFEGVVDLRVFGVECGHGSGIAGEES